jgi:hypothetical protein
MELPRLTGFTHDARPYELTARAGAQDVMRPDLLELKDISAHVELESGERVELKSASGLYDTKAEILKLSDRIVMTSSSGYEGRLSEATVNVGSGHIVSESPVEVKLLNGWLNAKRLEILDSDDLIVFTRRNFPLKTKITKTTVDALKPGAILADVEIKGFVCRALPSGTLDYGFRYRHNGRQRWLPLGEAREDGLHLVHDPRLLADKILPLPVWPPRILLLNRRNHDHAAMALLAAQQPRKARIRSSVSRRSFFARRCSPDTAMLVGWMT